jgi:hypothetical protein
VTVGLIIASVIGAIALILCIPIHGLIEVRVEETLRFGLRIKWFFGAFNKQIAHWKTGSAEEDSTRPKQRENRGWAKAFSKVLTDSDHRAILISLLRAVARSTKVENLEADFRLGLDDPVDTALIFGPAGAASVLLNLYTDYNIWLIPALEGETIQGYLNARFRWLPIILFRPFMKFLFSNTGRRIVRLVTVSEIKGNYHFNDNSLGGYCTKQPIALALVTSKGVKAFSIDGEEIKIQDFVNKFPDTKPLLTMTDRA